MIRKKLRNSHTDPPTQFHLTIQNLHKRFFKLNFVKGVSENIVNVLIRNGTRTIISINKLNLEGMLSNVKEKKHIHIKSGVYVEKCDHSETVYKNFVCKKVAEV